MQLHSCSRPVDSFDEKFQVEVYSVASRALTFIGKDASQNLIWFPRRTRNGQEADFSSEDLVVCFPNAQISVKCTIAQARKPVTLIPLGSPLQPLPLRPEELDR